MGHFDAKDFSINGLKFAKMAHGSQFKNEKWAICIENGANLIMIGKSIPLVFHLFCMFL